MKSKLTRFFVAYVFSAVLLLALINFHEYGIHTYMIIQKPIAGFFSKGEYKPRGQCRLTQLDPWDPLVKPFLYPDWNPPKKCTVKRIMFTELQNGALRMIGNTTSKCKFRCLYANGELDFKGDEWVEMEKNVTYYKNCDFIETHCTKRRKTTFRYIHVQLTRPLQKQFQKEDQLHPGVFILVFDSTSSSSGIRTMIETNQMLRQLYDATTFYYHNKAGINSRPNAHAMFSGRRITELDERRFPGKSAPELQNSCENGVQKNETVTYDFVNQSYASIIAEDWVGAFNWPNCKGYGEPPTDHYGGAMILRSTDDKSKEVINEFETYFYKGECHKPYHKLMDFVDQFLNEYNGFSKFVMIWLSLLTHDSANALYHLDQYFADFFRKHVNHLNNSFIFLMGDHGLRFGGIRQTTPGTIEDNNPLLTVAVPKYLRLNEQLVMNLKKNSRRHTSQYDFYATLYDIARYARKDGFKKWDEHDFSKEFGPVRGGVRAKSLLRPILYDRTCEEMEIPEEYCICNRTWHKLQTDSENVTEAARVLIADINDYLKQEISRNICETLHLTKVHSAEYLDEEPVVKIVIIALPSNGKYEAQLLKENDSFKVITRVTRVDEYDKQGDCMKNETVRPLCYCREQKTISTK